jgi:hypothetical protein
VECKSSFARGVVLTYQRCATPVTATQGNQVEKIQLSSFKLESN